MAWVEILPGYESLFRHRKWESASSFLAWTGILVNKHRQRQVEQVFLPSPLRGRGTGGEGAEAPASGMPATPLPQAERGEVFFLKKEYAVSWRDRCRNAWHGFGWCSTAVREAAILQALHEAGIGCPEVVALGEDQRQAFVLLRDAGDMIELRVLLQQSSTPEDRNRLADALGRSLARMHDAGFDHPDLFAKHILVAARGTTFRFCIVDWQRGRRRRSVAWSWRCRDLAVLDATLHDALASDRLRLRCLRAYAQSARDCMPLGRLVRQVRSQAERLRENRNLREIGQLPVAAGDQQFVPLREGRLLVVRTYYEELRQQIPDWLTQLSEPEAQARGSIQPLACASGSDKRLLQEWAESAADREIPPQAHTLFRLQRFGVPAPRLLAVAYADARAFLVAESAATVPFEEALAKASFSLRSRLLQQAGVIIRQIHEAGYYLPAGDTWARRLGVTASTGVVSLVKVEPLPRDRVSWRERAPTELNRQKIRLSRGEQLRFLHGYLQRQSGKNARRDNKAALFMPNTAARERQAVS
jgi:tRNA A-37 threonylcarbamoyl transferase component Bud32